MFFSYYGNITNALLIATLESHYVHVHVHVVVRSACDSAKMPCLMNVIWR